MKRLTSRDVGGDAFVEKGVLKTTTYTECDTAFGKRHVPYGDIYYGNVIDRLAQYEDAEEQGLLVRLPCNVGDTVYKHWKVGGKTEIGSALVTGFEIADDGINYCYRVKRFDRKETIKKFGKTVFLTREEAEDVLKGGAE